MKKKFTEPQKVGFRLRGVSISTYLMNDLQVFKKSPKSDQNDSQMTPQSAPLSGSASKSTRSQATPRVSTGCWRGGRYFPQPLLKQVPISATRVRGKQGQLLGHVVGPDFRFINLGWVLGSAYEPLLQSFSVLLCAIAKGPGMLYILRPCTSMIRKRLVLRRSQVLPSVALDFST